MTNNNRNPYSLHRQWIEEDEREHDDYMDAIAYDRRAAERDGWKTDTWDGH